MDNSLFKKLSPELRNQVYALVLTTDDGEKKTDISNWKADTSLLRVCRQIRFEASSIYYSNNDFYYLVSAGDGMNAKWEILSDWVDLIGTTNARRITSLEIDYDLSQELEDLYSKHPRRYDNHSLRSRRHSLAPFAPLTIDILRTLDESKAKGLVSAIVTGTSYPKFVQRVLNIIGQPSGPTAPLISRLANTIEMWNDEEAESAMTLGSLSPGTQKMRPRLLQSMRPKLKEKWEATLRESLRTRLLELAELHL